MANVIKFMSKLIHKTTITRHQNYCSRYSNVSKDLMRSTTKEPSTTSIHNHDILLGTLKTAPTTANILDIVKSHAVVMNNKHLIQALRSLFVLQKGGHSKLSTPQILKHPDFELLCKYLKRNAGSIELYETIEALKVVCYVGVASDSTIVQVLLQLLRHQVNALNLQQIIFLDFLLNQMKATPLIEALQLGLPLIFEIQLPIKVDRDNITQLAECLHFASKKNVSSNCIEFLVNAIMKYKGEIESKTIISLLWSICDLKSDDFFEPLIAKLIDDLIVDIDRLSYNDIETTLSKLTMRYSNRYRFYYSDVLCDLVGNYVIDHDMGHEAAIFTLKKFHKLLHTSDRLLNYVSDKYLENEEIFHNSDPMFIFNYINSLALTDYRPNQWDSLKMLLAKTSMFKNLEKRDIIWLRLAANFCALNIFKLDVFEMAFRENYLKKIFKTNFISDFEFLVMLKQSIMTYKPELASILPPDYLVNKAIAKVRNATDYPLEGALLNVFGGDKYVKTAVTTNLHHHIDHLVVLRKGGYPVAFATPDSPNVIEDIELSEDSQIIAIMGLGPQHFTSNTKRLKSLTALTLRTLEKKCTVVAINTEVWMQLPDFERIPYLMRLIKAKTNDNEVISNVNL